jgi:SAM-dependent methyltransferase
MKLGFTDVTLVDISDVVVHELEQKFRHYIAAGKLTIKCCDFFNLDANFDLIIEQTFFCAINPVLRENYAQQVNRLLRPAGKLAGVLFNTVFEGGPPFGGNREEYLGYFSPLFLVRALAPCYNSIKPREGKELFILLEKKN